MCGIGCVGGRGVGGRGGVDEGVEGADSVGVVIGRGAWSIRAGLGLIRDDRLERMAALRLCIMLPTVRLLGDDLVALLGSSPFRIKVLPVCRIICDTPLSSSASSSVASPSMIPSSCGIAICDSLS